MYNLLILPFDYEYDFLDELSHICRNIYRFVNVEVLNKGELPEHILLGPGSLFAKLIMRNRRMVYLDDLLVHLKKCYVAGDYTKILAILPHYVLGFGEGLLGYTPYKNLSIVSTYAIKGRYFSRACIGVCLHEIGHSFGLSHCKNKGCLMRVPCRPSNFYDGVYKLCIMHEKLLNFKS